MRRIGLAVVLAVSLTLATLAAEAQQAGKVYRVGVLASSSSIPDNIGNGRQAFLERLSELGWVVGQNLTFEPRSADQRLDRLPGLAAELVQLNVSMILALGHQAALAAKRATATIPIVIIAGDPVGSGLIASLAHPGGNITGLTNEASLEILSKRLELLKEASPKISRVGILANRSNTLDARLLDATTETPPYKYVSVEGPIVAIEAADLERHRRPLAHHYLGLGVGDRYIESTRDLVVALFRMHPERWLTRSS